MIHVRFGGCVIESAAYDPQCALLEICFANDGQVWHYRNVEEDLWYLFKKQVLPDAFFQQWIKGHYVEERVI